RRHPRRQEPGPKQPGQQQPRPGKARSAPPQPRPSRPAKSTDRPDRSGPAESRAVPAPGSRPTPPAAPDHRPPRLRAAKIALALVSALVLILTGYGWSTFKNLQNGLSTADVIGFSAPDGATDILLVGNDSRTDAQGNPLPRDVLAQLRAGQNEGELTDTMILVRIPNDGSRAVAISLPRDLYVEMPDGFGEHKLNSAYSRAKGHAAGQLVEDGADPATVHNESISAGRKLLLQTVEDLTGVGIDHYAEINLLGFSLLTEAVGGVQVCLKAPVHDEFSGADFPAGPQTITGPDALAFVRQRHGLPRGDLDRVVRQQVFLASLANRVLSAGTLSNPGRIRELVGATQQSLVLDDNFNVLDFAARIQGLAAGNVEFLTVPLLGEAQSDDEGAVLQADPEAVQAFAASAIGMGPQSGAGAPETTRITVDVLNASGVTGLASGVSQQLTDQGFGTGTVDNADARELSLVRYPTGEQDAARTVAEALGGLPSEEDPNLPSGTVQVYLGENYSGPGTDGFAGHSLMRLDGRSATGAVSGASHSPVRPGQAAQPPPPPTLPLVAGDTPCVD
ncbi:MAG TPA: LCP family protein, partial [Pseudonocardiaceae bacterium]|nr:LCP family protein [Pseudonocardiaceae bacterium]